MKKKFKNKKGIIIGVALVVVVAACVTVAVRSTSGSSTSDSSSQVYVDSVANICGLGSGNGLIDRFSGIVEPQKTLEIEVSSDKTVAEVLVKEGDEVKEGDALFTYDTQEMEENLAQAEIDLDRLANEIEQTTEQIASLKKEKASASSDQQLNYTTQINTAENEIKRNEYEQKSKKVEIEKLKNSIANATVTSEMDGVIKSINDSDDSSSSLTGDSEAFMTILATGTFRIKGTVNEQNASAIVEGQAVLVHSRVDDTVWKGTLTSVDFDNPEKDDSSYYYSSSDSSTDSSSNYPFYVDLESADGLMLGQHVYIEMDYGQDEDRDGIWLDSYYIVQEDDSAYVWAANSKDRMEKRTVTLGEFDEDLQQYEILDGLSEDDYIAFPDDTIKEGDTAVKNVDQISDYYDTSSDVSDFDEIYDDLEEIDDYDLDEDDDYDYDLDEDSYDYDLDEDAYPDEEYEGSLTDDDMDADTYDADTYDADTYDADGEMEETE